MKGPVRERNVDFTDTSRSSIRARGHEGEIMCWFASREQAKPAELMEYEEPGYSQSDFINIEPGTSEVSGRKIPAQFWEVFKALQAGEIGGITLPIVELDTLQ